HTHAHTHTHIHTHTHTQTHRSNMQMHMHHSGKHTLTVNERNLIYVNSNDMGHPNVHTFITLCLSLAFPLFSLPLFYTHTRRHTHTHTHTHTERLIGCRENICCFFFSVLYEVLTPSARRASRWFLSLSLLVSPHTPAPH